MALGKRKGSDFMPVFKYDAKAGSFYKQDRVLTQDGWGNEQTDVGDDLRERRVIFDLDTIETGWIYFPKGAAPETVLFPAGQDIGDAPNKDFKQGFRIIVKLDGDEPREFMSTAAATWYALDTLHTALAISAPSWPGSQGEAHRHDRDQDRQQHKLHACLRTRGLGGATARPAESAAHDDKQRSA